MSIKPQDIVVFGGIYVDTFSYDNPSIEASTGLGGKAANAAVGLSRLGHNVTIIGEVGDDSYGMLAIKTLASEGVDVSSIRVRNASSTDISAFRVDIKGSAKLEVNERINPTTSVQLAKAFFELIDRKEAVSPKCIYITLEPINLVGYVSREAKKRGIMVFCDNGPISRSIDTVILPNIQIISLNKEEAEKLAGISILDLETTKNAARQLIEKGVEVVLLTLGVDGAYCLTRGGFSEKTTIPYLGSVNEVGAGDAFKAAFLSEFLNTADLSRSLQLGSRAGAFVASRKGSYEGMPRLEDLLHNYS